MRDLRWVAQYADGRIVKEYEFVGSWASGRWVENWFKNIDLSQVISFGIEGAGVRVGFRADDGIIGINGKPLELALQSFEGYFFPITGRSDVFYWAVQYKEAHFGLGSGGGRPIEDSGIDAYCVGWIATGADEKLGLWQAKCVARVPAADGETIAVQLWFMCLKGFAGILRVRINGMEYPKINTILRPGTANRIAIHVNPRR